MRPNWGSVLVGASAGLAAGMLLAVPLLAVGYADTETLSGQMVLITVVFVGQMVSGYVAARVAGRDHPLNGSLAALSLFAATTAISLAAGSEPGSGTLVFNGVVAAVLGTAGGVLVQAREQAPGG